MIIDQLYSFFMLFIYCSYFLSLEQTTGATVSGLVVLVVRDRLVLYNPRLAWANTSAMPSWVAKRIKPLTQEQVS